MARAMSAATDLDALFRTTEHGHYEGLLAAHVRRSNITRLLFEADCRGTGRMFLKIRRSGKAVGPGGKAFCRVGNITDVPQWLRTQCIRMGLYVKGG